LIHSNKLLLGLSKIIQKNNFKPKLHINNPICVYLIVFDFIGDRS
jgi:hypothetical protein